MASDKPVREQNLAIRVMRLSRPRFNMAIPLIYDPDDRYSMAIFQSLSMSNTSIGTQIDSCLMAPHTMRDIYLGEQFIFYISIINTSTYTCKEISIKADMQTQSQRISIGESSFNEVVLVSNQQIGRTFTHEIQELGQHILVCAVTYKSANENKMNLRKFFKFPVSKPLELVKQNFYEIENCTLFFEARIKNLCVHPIYIGSTSLTNPGSNTYSKIISTHIGSNSITLGSQCVRQYIFELKPSDGKESENWSKIHFGNLSINWRTTMGDKIQMHLETTQQIVHSLSGNLRFLIETMPKRVKINELFSALFRIENCCDRPLDLLLTFDQSHQSSIVHCSVNGQRFPTLLQNHSMNVSLDFLPHVHGLQQISGIRITDLKQKKTYDFDDVTQIFIY